MRVAILGTRGIPNNYGGFEQCAEYLALGLVKKGFEVLVYNSHNHPCQESIWNGVNIVHCYDPEYKMGTAGQFVYDLNCILDVRKRDCDVILQLGYTSSSVWGWLLPSKSVVTTNMDGLEWKRTKYKGNVRRFLLFAERLGVRYSDHLISDSVGIQDYLLEKYGVNSTFIPYGANLFDDQDKDALLDFHLEPYGYDMLIARLEPENSIETILDGVVKSKSQRQFIVIGNHETTFGDYLKKKYEHYAKIRFIGGVYDINILNNLRCFSNLYFHGHTVGGTNPSLLEAMASNSLISAHENPFNKYILNEDAVYFTTSDDVANHLNSISCLDRAHQHKILNNRQKISELYSWEKIVDEYSEHLIHICPTKKEKEFVTKAF